ncbi:hypothetical protein [Streptomyces sp. NBC_00996]|uniref:hypothetical protein n=1 Tax=Streptomyces sp. NBC_00996 TaxID=2903710 RepID=UPI003863C5A3|nr:hypothetical protein OG390_09155 [Streptomyces sp. NBC_00996]
MFKRRERRVEESGPYYKQRNWQLSAGFLGVAVVVGLIVTMVSGNDTTTPDRAKAATSDGPLSDDSDNSAAKDSRPHGCRTDDSAGAALPTAAPKDVERRKLGVSQLPVSASAGPTRISGDLWWCFAHTPTGAALAATIIPSQMSGSNWRTVTERQVVAGSGREMWEFKRATVKDIDSENTDVTPASYVGFEVTSYKSSAASVKLLLKSSQGFAATTIDLRWNGGDWKVLPDGDGSLHTPVSSISDTNSFILWGV